jgi:hypothetical protein
MDKSTMIKDKAIGRGQTLKSAYPQDNLAACNTAGGSVKIPDCMGGKFGGSDENISHSLKGATTVDSGSVK